LVLATLFQNLREHLIADNGINFAESVAPWDVINQLRHINFDESGEQLKAIIESSYADGVDGFENVRVQDNKITGIFIDIISPSLTKRYEFTVTANNVSYSPINRDEIEATNFEEPEFVATAKKKNCKKGFACGGTCLPLKTKSGEKTRCNHEPTPQQKEIVKDLIEKGKGKSKSSKTPLASKTDSASNVSTKEDKGAKNKGKSAAKNNVDTSLPSKSANLEGKNQAPPPSPEETAKKTIKWLKERGYPITGLIPHDGIHTLVQTMVGETSPQIAKRIGYSDLGPDPIEEGLVMVIQKMSQSKLKIEDAQAFAVDYAQKVAKQYIPEATIYQNKSKIKPIIKDYLNKMFENKHLDAYLKQASEFLDGTHTDTINKEAAKYG
jgi:hypothetical protein